jgi:cation diffusion facilitator CzcD-associated flavoprotein CzcO
VLQVLAYLEAFADAYGLHNHIQLNTAVMCIDPVINRSHVTAAAAATDDSVSACAQTPECGCSAGQAEANAAVSAACCGSCRCSSACCVHHGRQAAAGAVFPLQPHHHLQWKVVTQHSSSSQHSRDIPTAASQAAACTQADASAAGVKQQAQQQEWLFDAVAVCVGIFSEPNLPQVPGMRSWPGLQLHSHNYRSAEDFKGQTVMVVGASFSGGQCNSRYICTPHVHRLCNERVVRHMPQQ